MACVLWSGVAVFEKDPGRVMTTLRYRATGSYSYMEGWPETSTYLHGLTEKITNPPKSINVVNPVS